MGASVIAALVLFLSNRDDLTVEPLGPTTIVTANTPAGEAFLKGLPKKFGSPTVEVKNGVESIIGRAEFDPKYRSLWVCPSLVGTLEKDAASIGLKVKHYDPWEGK